MNSDVRDILELDEPIDNEHDQQRQRKFSKFKLSYKSKKLRRVIEPLKRPQGVHREVWGLLNKDNLDNQPPLIPAEEPIKLYKHPKAKLRHGVRKWAWVPFKNPARKDSATFNHWRCINDDPDKEYPFAKYNKQIKLLEYTDSEYAQYLSDENWSRAETDYLFELCKRYDLRFFIIHDRWDPRQMTSLKNRSIDELKDRYYKVLGVMQQLRNNIDESQVYTFDLDHEQKRRKQLEKLFERTKEQVDEEIYLMEELKKIEIRKKERERKQQDVNKLLTAVVDLENSNKPTQLHQLTPKLPMQQMSISRNNSIENRTLTSSISSMNGLNTKRVKQRKMVMGETLMQQAGLVRSNNLNASIQGMRKSLGSNLTSSFEVGMNSIVPPLTKSMSFSEVPKTNSHKKSLIFKAVVESTGIKFPDTNKVSGVFLRSHKMKLPPSVGQKKIKAMDQLLDEFKIDAHPIATESICEQFNDLRSDTVLLYELQQAFANCEFELQTLRHRYEPILLSKNIDLSKFDVPAPASSYSSSSFPSLANKTKDSLNESKMFISSNVVASSSIMTTPMNASLSLNQIVHKRFAEMFDASFASSSNNFERRRKAALNQTNVLKRLRGRHAS